MSEELDQFYDDIMVTLFDGSYGAVEQFGLGFVTEVGPSVSVENDQVFGKNGWAKLIYEDEPDTAHTVSARTIAHGFTIINGTGEIRFLGESQRNHLRKAYRERDAGDIDAVDACAILEIALFGEVVYG